MTLRGLGQLLRGARERRGLTVEQLAEQTTIPVADVEALEGGMIDVLPRGMYRRAEARAYAEAVGLDPDIVLTELRLASTVTATAPALVARAPENVSDVPRVLRSLPERVAEVPLCVDVPPGGVRTGSEGMAVPAATSQVRALVPMRARFSTSTSNSTRLGRAVMVLVIGCTALFLDRERSRPVDAVTPGESITTSTVTLPALDAASMVEEVARIAEPPKAAPAMRRVLYEPGRETIPAQPAGGARRDEGMLVVRSSPAGARVTVNGVGWGETPVAIRYLPLGTLRVRVAKSDHTVVERVVDLTRANPSSTLRLSLVPTRRRAASAPAPRGDMLVITSVPEGARVTVNGIGWGTTPVSIPHLPAGAQRVRIVKDQFRTEERVVHVAEQRPGRVAVTLKPQS